MSVSQVSLSSVENNSLSEVFDLSQPHSTSSALKLTSTALIASPERLNSVIQTVLSSEDIGSRNSKNQIQIVVFPEIKLSTLIDLCKHSGLALTSIDQMVTRSNKTSLRFGVTCNDINESRKLIASFNEAENIESALIHQSPKLSEPGLLVMDMDSTAIKIECIDEIAKLAGTGEEVAKVTAKAMQGKLDFKQSLYQRVATLKGANEAVLQEVLDDLPLMEGLESLITELKANNWRLAIASGGFTYFADHLKETLGLDAAYSNQLEIIDGKLTGKVLGEIVDANKKASVLNALAEQYAINSSQTVAIGDGANDLVMMSHAQLGVACHGKAIVKQTASTSVNKAPLDTLLHWLA